MTDLGSAEWLDIKLYGNAFTHKEHGRLDPERMTIDCEPDPENPKAQRILRYRYVLASGREIVFPLEAVVRRTV